MEISPNIIVNDDSQSIQDSRHNRLDSNNVINNSKISSGIFDTEEDGSKTKNQSYLNNEKICEENINKTKNHTNDLNMITNNENIQEFTLNTAERTNYREKIKKYNFTFGYILILIFISTIYVFYSARFYGISHFSLCEFPLKYKNQYYRIFSHNFVHLNFVHFIFLVYLLHKNAPKIEKKIGTLMFLAYVNLSVYLIGICYILMIKLSKFIMIDVLRIKVGLDFSSTVGMSAIIFSLNFLDSYCSEQSYAVYEGIQVNLRMRPFYLILLVQVINPKSSLFGHLSGIVASFLIIKIFSYFMLPKIDFLMKIESIWF